MATSDPQRGTAPGLSAFRAEARPVVDGIGEVVVEGEIDVATAPQLREALHQVLEEGATRLRIDLGEVGFIDSAGLGVLIGVLKRIREVGGEIELVHVQPAPRKVIEITGLDELFTLND
jgi:anti-sigma B factor antagonist